MLILKSKEKKNTFRQEKSKMKKSFFFVYFLCLNIPEQTPFQQHQWLWQEGFSPSTPRLLERTLFHILLCRHQSSENKHNCLLLTNLGEQLQMSDWKLEENFS